MHEVQFSKNNQWHVGQEIRHVIFQESVVIPPCKPVWKYVGSEQKRHHKNRSRCWRTSIGDVMEESQVDFLLATDADCENYCLLLTVL
jgi:hypothetical protein